MKPTVHLLYFEGCPNVEIARANLGVALNQLRLPREWVAHYLLYVKGHGNLMSRALVWISTALAFGLWIPRALSVLR